MCCKTSTTIGEKLCDEQEVVRELLVLRNMQKRKVKRHLQRHATEMGAARLTGRPCFFLLLFQLHELQWEGQSTSRTVFVGLPSSSFVHVCPIYCFLSYSASSSP